MTDFAPRDWHIHEMLFGYVAAVVAGLLLTTVPNWTGRPSAGAGWPLISLFAPWVAGRIAVIISAEIGWLAMGLIDSTSRRQRSCSLPCSLAACRLEVERLIRRKVGSSVSRHHDDTIVRTQNRA